MLLLLLLVFSLKPPGAVLTGVLSLLVSAAEPLPLMDLCRRSVRLALGKGRLGEIHALPLPASLKTYLLYQ